MQYMNSKIDSEQALVIQSISNSSDASPVTPKSINIFKTNAKPTFIADRIKDKKMELKYKCLFGE